MNSLEVAYLQDELRLQAESNYAKRTKAREAFEEALAVEENVPHNNKAATLK